MFGFAAPSAAKFNSSINTARNFLNPGPAFLYPVQSVMINLESWFPRPPFAAGKGQQFKPQHADHVPGLFSGIIKGAVALEGKCYGVLVQGGMRAFVRGGGSVGIVTAGQTVLPAVPGADNAAQGICHMKEASTPAAGTWQA